MLKCKIIQKNNVYNLKQVFGKSANFNGVAFFKFTNI